MPACPRPALGTAQLGARQLFLNVRHSRLLYRTRHVLAQVYVTENVPEVSLLVCRCQPTRCLRGLGTRLAGVTCDRGELRGERQFLARAFPRCPGKNVRRRRATDGLYHSERREPCSRPPRTPPQRPHPPADHDSGRWNWCQATRTALTPPARLSRHRIYDVDDRNATKYQRSNRHREVAP